MASMRSVTAMCSSPGRWQRPLAYGHGTHVVSGRAARHTTVTSFPTGSEGSRNGRYPQVEGGMNVETCPSCGAHVSADAAWCGQCFTSLARPEEHAPDRVVGTLAARRPPPREEAHTPTYSRFRG